VSVHTTPASVHDVFPAWHWFEGTQLAPASQVAHMPLEHAQKPLSHVLPPPHALP
jgi:hypothetical protein